jgi:hypothetical protein
VRSLAARTCSDQGIGVSLDVYTTSDVQKGAAAEKSEDSVLGRKVVRMPGQKAW